MNFCELKIQIVLLSAFFNQIKGIFLEIFAYNKIFFKAIIKIYIYYIPMKYTIIIQNRNLKSQQKPHRFF